MAPAERTLKRLARAPQDILDRQRQRKYVAIPVLVDRHRHQKLAERRARTETQHRDQAAGNDDDSGRLPGGKLRPGGARRLGNRCHASSLPGLTLQRASDCRRPPLRLPYVEANLRSPNGNQGWLDALPACQPGLAHASNWCYIRFALSEDKRSGLASSEVNGAGVSRLFWYPHMLILSINM
jgi:hypothetical protein